MYVHVCMCIHVYVYMYIYIYRERDVRLAVSSSPLAESTADVFRDGVK